MRKRTLTLVAALLCLPAGSYAQSWRVGGGVGYEVFSFGSPADVAVENISLLTVPLAARINLSNAFSIEALTAWASGSVKRANGSETTLSGPTDTELRLLLGLGRGLVTITGIAQLPTGKESLSDEEADLAGFIAADVLPFRISSWGTGGGAGLNATVTRTLGSIGAGFSVGYIMAAEFEPVADDAFTYRPGSQLSVRAAFDRTFASSGKASLVLSFQSYATDQLDGNNLFRSGARYEALGSYAFAIGQSGAGIAYLGFQRRAEGEYIGISRVFPLQNLLYAGWGVELPAGRVLVRPRVDLRMLRREDGVGQGYTASAGADLEVPLRTMSIVPTLRGRFGNVLMRDDAESGFTGVDAGVTLRFGGPR